LYDLRGQNFDTPIGDCHEIWNKLGELHENFVRWHWDKAGRSLDLQTPELFSEKIEWLKLNDHRELYIQFCDKLAVRDYVLERTGDPCIFNKIYGSYDRAENIPIDKMPDKFVVKANHFSGGNLICHQDTLKRLECRDMLNKYVESIYSFDGGEWPYWHVKPKLLVEEYLEDQFSQLVDYKVFCFEGEPRIVMVCMDRNTDTKKLYLDTNWKVQPFMDSKYSKIRSGLSVEFPRPESLDKMLNYANILAYGTAFLRVDFYDLFGECRFGELTLYPEGGVGEGVNFVPDEWNYTLGKWLKIPPPCSQRSVAYGIDNETIRRLNLHI